MTTNVVVVAHPGDSADVDSVRNGLAAAGIGSRGAYVGAAGDVTPLAEHGPGVLVAVYGTAAASSDGATALDETVGTATSDGKSVFVYRTPSTPSSASLPASSMANAPASIISVDSLHDLVSAVRAALQQQVATHASVRHPGAAPTMVLGRGAEALNRYRQLSGLSRATVVLFGLTALGLLVQIIGMLAVRGNPILGLLAGFGFLVWLLSGIAGLGTYFVWFYRAHKNLEALNARDTRYSSAWTVAGYFVPFLNLVRPYQMMVEVWKGSNPDSDVTNPSAWKDAPSSPLVGIWWAVHILEGIVAWGSNIAQQAAVSESPDTGRVTTDWPAVLTTTLMALTVLLTAALVAKVTERQRLRYARLSGGKMPE